MLPDNPFVAFALIFMLRLIDVSMGTIRTVYIFMGKKLLSTAIAFFEVTLFIFAVSSVVSNAKDKWYLMLAYSGGFAAGTLIGILLENLFAVGYSQVRVISKDKGPAIAENLWANKFGATIVHGKGREGDVDMIFSVVPRKQLKQCQKVIDEIDDTSFITVSDSRYFVGGFVPHHRK